jgi:hypothetical protein
VYAGVGHTPHWEEPQRFAAYRGLSGPAWHKRKAPGVGASLWLISGAANRSLERALEKLVSAWAQTERGW